MTSFNDSTWSNNQLVQEYLETADDVIPNRDQMMTIALSLYHFFLDDRKERRVLDLGCGDGLLTNAIIGADPMAKVTALDASAAMLEAARKRLDHSDRVQFIQAGFQDLIAGMELSGPFDAILSFLSIHHIDTQEKAALFQYLFDHLSPGGLFIVADPTRPVTESLETWSLELWRQWAQKHLVEKRNRQPNLIPERLGQTLDPLVPQMQSLIEIGFEAVECYYKHGMFAMFGGRRSF